MPSAPFSGVIVWSLGAFGAAAKAARPAYEQARFRSSDVCSQCGGGAKDECGGTAEVSAGLEAAIFAEFKKDTPFMQVKGIRLVTEDDHNIDCRIEGIGAMALKSEFVKKA
jgi:hypothetical protein